MHCVYFIAAILIAATCSMAQMCEMIEGCITKDSIICDRNTEDCPPCMYQSSNPDCPVCLQKITMQGKAICPELKSQIAECPLRKSALESFRNSNTQVTAAPISNEAISANAEVVQDTNMDWSRLSMGVGMVGIVACVLGVAVYRHRSARNAYPTTLAGLEHGRDTGGMHFDLPQNQTPSKPVYRL